MSLTIEEAMCNEQRFDLPLQRELEWECRHNYINSMMSQFCQLFPSSFDNAADARRCLATILTVHDQCANEAIETLARRQYEEVGLKHPGQLAEFEVKLQMQLLKMLQQQAPQLMRWLQSGDDSFALATALTVGTMSGERLPVSSARLESNNRRSTASPSKVKTSSSTSLYDTSIGLHRQMARLDF